MPNNNAGYELDWNAPIEHDSEFELLPEGEYDFEVLAFERGRHDGSDKLPPCNKATLTVKLSGEAGSTTIKHNLFLHSSTEGILCAFFIAIGQREHGQKVSMNWNKVIGAKGRCKVGTRSWQGNDGQERKSNQITRFLEPTAKPAAGYQAGRF